MFPVKSAYRFALAEADFTLLNYSYRGAANQRVWKKISQAKMPISAEVTAWKLDHNIIIFIFLGKNYKVNLSPSFHE